MWVHTPTQSSMRRKLHVPPRSAGLLQHTGSPWIPPAPSCGCLQQHLVPWKHCPARPGGDIGHFLAGPRSRPSPPSPAPHPPSPVPRQHACSRPGNFVLACALRTFERAEPSTEPGRHAKTVVLCGETEWSSGEGGSTGAVLFDGCGGYGNGTDGAGRILPSSCLEVSSRHPMPPCVSCVCSSCVLQLSRTESPPPQRKRQS